MQPGSKVIPIGAVLPVDCVVAAGVVRALHPDLAKVAVTALALRLGVRDDDGDAGEQLAGLHQGKGVRAASLDQSDSVVPEIYNSISALFSKNEDTFLHNLPKTALKRNVPECPEINIDCGGIWGRRSLQADRDVLPAAERGRDRAGGKAQRGEEGREAVEDYKKV